MINRVAACRLYILWHTLNQENGLTGSNLLVAWILNTLHYSVVEHVMSCHIQSASVDVPCGVCLWYANHIWRVEHIKGHVINFPGGYTVWDRWIAVEFCCGSKCNIYGLRRVMKERIWNENRSIWLWETPQNTSTSMYLSLPILHFHCIFWFDHDLSKAHTAHRNYCSLSGQGNGECVVVSSSEDQELNSSIFLECRVDSRLCHWCTRPLKLIPVPILPGT